MLQDSSAIPHNWTQWFWLIVASSLGYAASLLKEWITRRRTPAEDFKTEAEARQIEVSTNVDLVKAATQAIVKVERLQSEREHWERKACDEMIITAQLKIDLAQAETRSTLQLSQIKKLKGLLDAHGISFSEADKPKP